MPLLGELSRSTKKHRKGKVLVLVERFRMPKCEANKRTEHNVLENENAGERRK